MRELQLGITSATETLSEATGVSTYSTKGMLGVIPPANGWFIRELIFHLTYSQKSAMQWYS